MTETVLEVEHLVKHYPVSKRLFAAPASVRAVDGVSFGLAKGETFAIVGESGCGKSTLARCLIRLEEPTSGKIFLYGTDIAPLGRAALRPHRRRLQIVFQDPYASLDPRQRIGDAIRTPLRLHGIGMKREQDARVLELLQQVGLAREFLDRHPHELSGGQRQRVAIARALAAEPEIVVLDEPVSALDVSVQAQVMNLLMRLQDRLRVTYLLISHNLPLVQHVAERVAVMYLGQIVELSDRGSFNRMRYHPYTQALFAAPPRIGAGKKAAASRPVLSGELPSPLSPPSGCRFHTRCPFKKDICVSTAPALRPVGGHLVACHFAGEVEFQSVDAA